MNGEQLRSEFKGGGGIVLKSFCSLRAASPNNSDLIFPSGRLFLRGPERQNCFCITLSKCYLITYTERKKERECVCVCMCVCAIYNTYFKRNLKFNRE